MTCPGKNALMRPGERFCGLFARRPALRPQTFHDGPQSLFYGRPGAMLIQPRKRLFRITIRAAACKPQRNQAQEHGGKPAEGGYKR
jgi:hypothetical protein